MPAKEERRVLATGDSVAISIPKPYADYHGLKPGKRVLIFYDGLMLVVPSAAAQKLRKCMPLVDELLRKL